MGVKVEAHPTFRGGGASGGFRSSPGGSDNAAVTWAKPSLSLTTCAGACLASLPAISLTKREDESKL